jgi:hypothetical protein
MMTVPLTRKSLETSLMLALTSGNAMAQEEAYVIV